MSSIHPLHCLKNHELLVLKVLHDPRSALSWTWTAANEPIWKKRDPHGSVVEYIRLKIKLDLLGFEHFLVCVSNEMKLRFFTLQSLVESKRRRIEKLNDLFDGMTILVKSKDEKLEKAVKRILQAFQKQNQNSGPNQHLIFSFLAKMIDLIYFIMLILN